MIVILKRRHAVKVECKLEGDVEKFILQHASVTPKRYKYSEIKKMTKCWSEKLGEGGYGSVYKGMLPVPDGRVVAVKVLNKVDSKGEDFKNEVASISKTSHVNIVTLLGFCYDQNHSRGRALVYEFMPNGSLDKYLNQSKSILIKLDSQKLHKIALGVAKGLQYLHTGCTTRIVHFDIKPHNILLDEDFCPKISDFGLAKPCKKKQSIVSMPETRGTYGYIAPEVYSRSLGGVSHKSDVYSYGMMLFDMVGARKLVVDHGAQALILSGSTDNYFPDKIYKKAKPSDRPSISKVIEMLEGSLKSIQIPPNPSVFSSTLPTPDHISSSSSE
ncbi:hypothetical protein C2S51_029056 [Perilla frutescens var. frutescens]|nr:hypothetical protein C2S51_029056 [Perilla frutescens var. frutescens]